MKNKWTAADVGGVEGKLAVVTGANCGIGFQVALELARHGAGVILGCRDARKGAEAVVRIKEQVAGARVQGSVLDLADLSSVRAFARGMEGRGEGVDLLVNNAGVMAVPTRRLTKDGFELQFGTNHLGHFALTGLMLPLVMKSGKGRVVTVSSIAHKSGRMEFDNLNGERRYKDLGAYNNSKLANLLFAFELQRRLEAVGSGVVSIAAHPGVATTNLFGAGSRLDRQPLFSRLTEMFVPLLGQSDARGAWPVLFAATSEEAVGGGFYGPNGFAQFKGYPTEIVAAKQAGCEETARRLWEVSEEMTRVSYLDVGAAVGV